MTRQERLEYFQQSEQENKTDQLEHMLELHGQSVKAMQALIDASRRYGYTACEIDALEDARDAFDGYAKDGVLCEAHLAADPRIVSETVQDWV